MGVKIWIIVPRCQCLTMYRGIRKL